MNNLIIPCIKTTFSFKRPFPNTNKELIIQSVLDYCEINNLLNGITVNYSTERGFQLPLTQNWLNANLNKNKCYLNQHASRQLRFDEQDGIIYGMRLMDDIDYMTDAELNKIKELVEKTISELNY